MRSNALVMALLLAAPGVALADPPANGTDAPTTSDPIAAPATTAPLAAQPDVQPPATPAVQRGFSVRERKYAEMGVTELGASTGLTIASNLRAVNFSPSLGYFVNDTFEVSGIGSVSNISAGNESSTVWTALVEPSFHFAMDRQLYMFVGVGAGAAYIGRLGTALAVAPRVGLDVLVGKSGVLTPSLSYEYTMHDTMAAAGSDGTTDVTLLAASSMLRANIGYSVMW